MNTHCINILEADYFVAYVPESAVALRRPLMVFREPWMNPSGTWIYSLLEGQTLCY